MMTVLLIIHLILCIALTGLILMQRSEGGALGIGGGGGPGSFMSGRAAANVLTRSTTILGALFFATSLGLTLLGNADRGPRSVVDQPVQSPAGLPTGPITLPSSPTIPEPAATAPVAPAPAEPAKAE